MRPEIACLFGRDPEANKGYLLLGDSGSGKTLLVKALATLLQRDLADRLKFYNVNYADITSIYRGGEAQATENIFKLVEQNEAASQRTLLFLDEIHLLGSRRKDSLPNEALDTLLTHLDGMRKYHGLTVIGATYMPRDSLDPALVRGGRLGTSIQISAPNCEERAEIFNIYVQKRKEIASAAGNNCLFDTIDLHQIGKATDTWNGSDIAECVEQVLRKKEEKVRSTVTGNHTSATVMAAFTPITTQDFLHEIKESGKMGQKRSGRVGFRGEGDKSS